jgi:hypothetical protein
VPKKPVSEKPSAARRRMRKSAENIERDIQILYKKPVEEWDMEELARGRPRGPNGKFQGPRPTWITPVILREASDRLRQLTKDELATYAGDAVRVMAEVMTSTEIDADGKYIVSPKTKLDAAKYVLDQIIGKPTNPVEVSGNVTLQHLMGSILVNPDGEEAHPVLDGEVVEDDQEDDDDGGE